MRFRREREAAALAATARGRASEMKIVSECDSGENGKPLLWRRRRAEMERRIVYG